MSSPDCKLYYFNGEIIHDPPLYKDYYIIRDGVKIRTDNPTIIYSEFFNGLPRSRENGIAQMVKSVIQKYEIKEDFTLHIRIADGPWEPGVLKEDGWDAPDIEVTENFLRPTMYSFSVYNKRYDLAFPDYIYIGQPESGLIDYTETVNNFVDTIPKNNKIGWSGALQCAHYPNPRTKFLEMSMKMPEIFDSRIANINTSYYDGYKHCENRMSYQNQVDEWKYLIDMEGCGWSGRFKVLMSSPRIVFFVDRPYHEWYFGEMVPWKHYVPVKRNLSDLIENYNRIESDIDLQNYIKTNQKIFVQNYLTREAGEKRVYEIILKMIEYYKNNPGELNAYRGRHKEYSEWLSNQDWNS